MSKSHSILLRTPAPTFAAVQAAGCQGFQSAQRLIPKSPAWPVATGRHGPWGPAPLRQETAETPSGRSEGYGGLLEGVGPSIGDLTVWGICKSAMFNSVLRTKIFVRWMMW